MLPWPASNHLMGTPLAVSGMTDGGDTRYRFQVLDLVTTIPPQADLVLCRDCLVHLSANDILKALRNIVASGARYLLSTTFVDRTASGDIVIGWHPVNLQLPHFRCRPRCV